MEEVVSVVLHNKDPDAVVDKVDEPSQLFTTFTEGVEGVIHICNTLLSAAPLQSLKQSTLANLLNHVVCVKALASYIAELLEAISLKPALLLVTDDCHLYSSVPVCPVGAAVLVKAAGLNPLDPL